MNNAVDIMSVPSSPDLPYRTKFVHKDIHFCDISNI